MSNINYNYNNLLVAESTIRRRFCLEGRAGGQESPAQLISRGYYIIIIIIVIIIISIIIIIIIF